MKKRISHARLKKILHYNLRTGIWTWKVSLNRCIVINSRAGSNRGDGRWIIGIDGVLYLSSRLAWFYKKGVWPKFEVDHKDTDHSNDKWCNLREATSSQNNANKRTPRNNTTGFKGVSIDTRGVKQFRATIKIHKKQRCLGYYDTPKEAHSAYTKAAQKFFGKFANDGAAQCF